jgi:hypothetical protein
MLPPSIGPEKRSLIIILLLFFEKIEMNFRIWWIEQLLGNLYLNPGYI